jgi:hypothetical protein
VPLGHGRVPSPVLGRYSSVIWLGNDWNGDLDCWINTAVLPYLEAGGDLLLLAREGPHFIGAELRDYLGIQWTSDQTIYQCHAVHELLTDIARTGTQNSCQLFATTLSQETSTLLYLDTAYNPDQGAGVLRAPEGGGSHDPCGARFAFLSGRPYRWAAADLARNVETIVTELFPTGAGAAQDPPAGPGGAPRLALAAASPVLSVATLHLELASSEPVRLRIFDAQGRLAATLLDGPLPAGVHAVFWNGHSPAGLPVPAGTYQALLTQGGARCSRRILLLH